jgi:hypothetical protein
VDPDIDALLTDDPEGDSQESPGGLAGAVRNGVATLDASEAAATLLTNQHIFPQGLPSELRDVLPRLVKKLEAKPNLRVDATPEENTTSLRIDEEPEEKPKSLRFEKSVENPQSIPVVEHKKIKNESKSLRVNSTELARMTQKAPEGIDKGAVEKAVKKLNGMIFASQIRLDDKVIECQEFKDKVTTTLKQVSADRDRLDATITRLAKEEIASNAAIQQAESDSQEVKEGMENSKVDYEKILAQDKATLAVHKADLKVTHFMLELSKCKNALISQRSQNFAGENSRAMQIEACSGPNGTRQVYFADPRLERSKSDRLLEVVRFSHSRWGVPQVEMLRPHCV